eukprot:scaffold26005_cov85-Cyclotella_meneghiniana.AAC.1
MRDWKGLADMKWLNQSLHTKPCLIFLVAASTVSLRREPARCAPLPVGDCQVATPDSQRRAGDAGPGLAAY